MEINLGTFLLTGLPIVLWHAPTLAQERTGWVLGARALSPKCLICGSETNTFVPLLSVLPDNSIHGEGRVDVLGNKESRAQPDNWKLSGLLPF